MQITSDGALEFEVADPFGPLCNPARYKAAYGGRGGAKSHFFAEQLVIRCYSRTLRAVCIREVQKSLRESVRQLLVDKINKFRLNDFYETTETEIRGDNGSLIIFRGMQTYNAETIKSLEGYDIAWVEEAQTLSDRSLRMLRPTIRKPGSELWFSWNPRHDTDPVDKFFRGAKPPSSAAIVNINWQDNPWFPDVLREEKNHDYATDPEMAAHIWGGGYEIITEGAYFARQIAQAESEGRVGFYPYDPLLPVKTAWDIGVDDYTAIWFLQINADQVRAIDYYESSGIGVDSIIREALPEMLKSAELREQHLKLNERPKPYEYDEHFLPHDVKMREWGAGARSRIESLIAEGMSPRQMRVGVATNPEDRIAAARRLLPFMHFDRNESSESGVNLGLSRLRKYSRRFNESLGVYTGPLKDGNDHGADAFGEFAVNCPLSRVPELIDEDVERDPAGRPIKDSPPVKVLQDMSYSEFHKAQKKPRTRV